MSNNFLGQLKILRNLKEFHKIQEVFNRTFKYFKYSRKFFKFLESSRKLVNKVFLRDLNFQGFLIISKDPTPLPPFTYFPFPHPTSMPFPSTHTLTYPLTSLHFSFVSLLLPPLPITPNFSYFPSFLFPYFQYCHSLPLPFSSFFRL